MFEEVGPLDSLDVIGSGGVAFRLVLEVGLARSGDGAGEVVDEQAVTGTKFGEFFRLGLRVHFGDIESRGLLSPETEFNILSLVQSLSAWGGGDTQEV